jgi:anti-sigma regulatory factor (Ser/Thr protein kinase)
MLKKLFLAKLENLGTMIEAIVGFAKLQKFDAEKLNAIQLAAEEILVNVIHYAYPGGQGDIEIMCRNTKEGEIIIQIMDWGIAFDPMAKEDPDINLPLEERQIGGLGIFLVKKLMDQVKYHRENGKNILTLIKKK